MSSLTLIDVRDWLNNCAVSCTESSDISNAFLGDMADAIDEHIAGMGEPVAWRADWPDWRQYHDRDESPLPDSWESPPPKITPLFAAPPASGDVASLQSRLAAADALLRFMHTRFNACMDDSDRASIAAHLSENTHDRA